MEKAVKENAYFSKIFQKQIGMKPMEYAEAKG